MANITINPDKTISIDGIKTFVVFMDNVISLGWPREVPETYEQSMAKNNNALLNYDLVWKDYPALDYWLALHNNANMMYLFDIHTGITQKIRDNIGFFAYHQVDEPTIGLQRYVGYTQEQMMADLQNAYDSHHTGDPNHPVILNHWVNAPLYTTMCDILSWDNYTIQQNKPWTRDMAIYMWEFYSIVNFLKNREIDSYSQPIYTHIQANGAMPLNFNALIPTIEEVRATAFTAICLGVGGIGFYGYQRPDAYLWKSPDLQIQVNILMGEIRSLNHILIRPSLDYGGTKTHPGTMVTFSNKYTVDILNGTTTSTNFIWRLKNDNLIIVNKDSRSITTNISIQGYIGTTIHRMAISGTSSKDITMSGNTFTDTFAGLAVHIYQLALCPDPRCDVIIVSN